MLNSLHELRNEINSIVMKKDDLTETQQFLREFQSRENILALLRLIRSEINTNDEIARYSNLHPNGFDRILVIANKKPEYRLRLHIWRNDNIYFKQEDIHNHSWNLASIIIAGCLRFENFQINESGQEKFHYEYKSTGLGNNPKVELKGKSRLSCTSDAIMTKGSYYLLSHQVFHRVKKPTDDIAATLMLQGPFLASSSQFFTDDEISNNNGEMTIKWLNSTELQKRLLDLESLI